MDKKRILLGLTIAAVLCALVLLVPSGSPFVVVVLLAVCALAMNEIYGMMAKAGQSVSRIIGLGSGLLFVGTSWWVARSGSGDDSLLWVVLAGILIAFFFRLLLSPNNALSAIRNSMGTLFGFAYVAILWSFFARLCAAGDLAKPIHVAFYLMLAVKWGDAGAYFVGSKFGRHRLAPAISPKKSWEGLLGGIVFSCIVGAVWCLATGGKLGPYHFPIGHALILGVVLPIIGTLGDLVESLFKRTVDMKDSGSLAHGMGGMLDMIDSLLFCAPFLYIYIHLFLD